MSALRRVAVFAVPAVLYFAVRPFTESDAVALGVGAVLLWAYLRRLRAAAAGAAS